MSNAITTIQHDASHQFRAAYEATTSERAALAATDLLPVNLDVQVAITTVLGAMPKLQSFRAGLDATFPAAQIEPLEKAEKYARALAYAQTVYLAASAPTEVLPELADRATKLRDLLLSDAKALAHRGLIDGKPLAELKGGTGYLNNASDLGVLVRMLRERWDVIATKSAIQPAEIDEAEKIFEQITMAYAARSQQSTVVAEATDDRQRAFTLLLNAYDQVRRVVTYLRWEAGDADRFAPSLWAGRGSRNANSEPAPKPEPQPPAPLPIPVIASAAPSPVGLPGSSPFAES